MTHDESEHMHAVYALQRGERPYRDFIENHPLAPHLVLKAYVESAGISDPGQLYGVARAVISLHFMATVLIVWLFLREWNPTLISGVRGATTFLIAVTFSGVWAESTEWLWGHRSLWHVRPDWLYIFYASCCIYLHFRYFNRVGVGGRSGAWMLVAGGACGAVATAILAKSALIFLPYALAMGVTALAWPRRAVAYLAANKKAVIGGNLLFLVSATLIFCVLVFTEVLATGVSVQDYVTANYRLNSLKHMTAIPEDFSPVNVLRSLSGLGLVSGFVLTTWSVLKLISAVRADEIRVAAGLLFLGAIVAINMTLPAFGNGLTWPHYMIPSVLAVWALVTWFLADNLKLVSGLFAPGGWVSRNVPLGSSTRILSAGGLFIAVMILFAVRIDAASRNVSRTVASRADIAKILDVNHPAFVQDRWLPDDLTYMIFLPHQKPAHARAWGYFHMLSLDSRWWVDNYKLGLGPDPRQYWRELYRQDPPDVVAISGLDDFLARRNRLMAAQGVDISWLWPELKDRYVCVSNDLDRLYVRMDKRHRLDAKLWRSCPPERFDLIDRVHFESK